MRIVPITVKLFRFELAVVVLACLATSVAAVFFGRQLIDATPTPDCLALTSGGPIFGGDTARCPSLVGFSSINSVAGLLLAAMGLMPFAIGGLVGSQLVATELDRETATLAWSLAPSRTQWLVDRAASPLAIIVFVLTVAAISSGYLEAARTPALQLARSFNDYGLWGPLLVFRGIAAFGVGLLVGAVTGRILPSLLITLAVGAALFVALPTAASLGQTLVPVVSDETPADEFPLHVIGGWRDPSGVVLTDEQARAMVPPGITGPGAAEDWLSEHFTAVGLGIPGIRLAEVVAREAALLLLGGIVLLALTGATLRRRRPR